MPKKNTRQYECDDCHEKQYMHWLEFNRAAKPRCARCGCTRLIVCSDDAKKEIRQRQTRVLEGSSGSLAVASRNRHRIAM